MATPFRDSVEAQALDACQDADVEALRRCLAAGVDPNFVDPYQQCSLLFHAMLRAIHDDVAGIVCMSMLLEAGASVELGSVQGSWSNTDRNSTRLTSSQKCALPICIDP